MVDGMLSLELLGAVGPTNAAMSMTLPCGGVREHAGRLRQRRHVRRAAALDPGLEHGLVARADAVDLDRDAGRRREVLDRGGEASPSPPIHCVWIETFLPLNGLSAPSASSSSV